MVHRAACALHAGGVLSLVCGLPTSTLGRHEIMNQHRTEAPLPSPFDGGTLFRDSSPPASTSLPYATADSGLRPLTDSRRHLMPGESEMEPHPWFSLPLIADDNKQTSGLRCGSAFDKPAGADADAWSPLLTPTPVARSIDTVPEPRAAQLAVAPNLSEFGPMTAPPLHLPPDFCIIGRAPAGFNPTTLFAGL